MSLQLHTEDTVITLSILVNDDKFQKATISLVTHDPQSQTVDLFIKELQKERAAIAYYDQDVIVYVNDGDITHEVKVRAYMNHQDQRVWLSIDAPEEVYISRYHVEGLN